MDASKVTGSITTAELQAALSTSTLSSSSGPALSTSRLSSSSGPDGIPVIALRIEEFEDDIQDTIDQSPKMVNTEYNIPYQWKQSIIVSIPKKGTSLSLDISEESLCRVRY